jgi:hypothetical protein
MDSLFDREFHHRMQQSPLLLHVSSSLINNSQKPQINFAVMQKVLQQKHKLESLTITLQVYRLFWEWIQKQSLSIWGPINLSKTNNCTNIYSALKGLYVRPTIINGYTIIQHCKTIFLFSSEIENKFWNITLHNVPVLKFITKMTKHNK